MLKRKDGLYQEYITIKEGGRSKRKYFYGRTKREVLKKIQDYREAEEVGRTFESVSDEWWDAHMKTLAHNTTKSYSPAVRRATGYFGAWYIREIKPVDINNFLLDFIEETHAAQKTASTQLTVINLICKYAVARGYINDNPARDLSVPRGLEHKKREIASDDDIKRIRYSTDCAGGFGMFAYWVLYTGLRRGELLALRWDDVDMQNRVINVRRSVYYIGTQAKIKTPKTDAGTRPVPLMDALFAKIGKKGKGLVFPGDDGKLMRNAHFENLWRKYCKESGVTCSPHQIRHAYTTMLYEEGIQVNDAQKILGHAQASTTQDIYTHIRQVRADKVKESLLSADYDLTPPKLKVL